MSIEGQWISRIAMHASAEQSLPALASKGAVISQSNWGSAGFETFNSKNLSEGDDYDMEVDGVTVTREMVIDELMAARDLAPEDVILISNRILAFTFKVLSVEEALLAFDCAMSQGSNITQLAGSVTNRHVCCEIRNLALDEFEKCVVQVTATDYGTGEGGKAISTVDCLPLKNSNAPGGWRRHHYQ